MRMWTKYLKTGLGYVWALAAIYLSVIGTVNGETIAEAFFVKTGFRVTENWRSGQVLAEQTHPGYRTVIYQPVFPDWLAKPGQGIVRIDWIPEPDLPVIINEAIDLDRDQQTDFTLRLNTRTNTVHFHSCQGRSLRLADEKVLIFKNSRSLRINILDRKKFGNI